MILTTLINGRRESRVLEDGAYMIGRAATCRVCLDDPSVSERHAVITVRDGVAVIEDLHSVNGVLINGEQIDGRVTLDSGMIIAIGAAMMRVSDDEPVEAAAAEVGGADTVGRRRESGLDESMRAKRQQVQLQIQRELLARMDMKKLSVVGTDDGELERIAREKIDQIVDEVIASGRLPSGIDAERLRIDVFNEAMRLGPLEDLLEDDTVSEIMVNGASRVYVERAGKLELSDCQFTDDAAVLSVIERIVMPLGRRVDESQPYVDARLNDGSRVNAIIAPLAISGPTLTIRKFSRRAFDSRDFIEKGTWTAAAADFMRLCVMMRKNIVVAGGTGSGKTTLLNLLSGFIPETERIITVEDAAELRLQQPHVVRLETRPANIEGKGAVTIRDLVRNCLRMRPDRIVVGECRGGEALDMLQAMNTGHDGSLTTVHANSPRDVIARLETMVMMSGMDLPDRAIREQIASAIGIVIHESRMSDGSRKVVAISEVTGMEGSQVVMQEIFAFEQYGMDGQGRVIGELKPTGAVPTWLEEAKSRGIEVDMGIFE